ncbi:MAG: glycosyltransferase family 39 protein, partial [Dehalococcoidia bacterium]
ALLAGLIWPLAIWRPPDAITASEPLSEMLGQSPRGLARFVLTLVVWAAGYLGALVLSRRPPTRAARVALLALPVLFAITLAPTWPAASKDLYHYVIEGRTLAVHGENPLVTPPIELGSDPLLWIVSSWEWEPSRYGPLWALVAAVPVRLAGDSLTWSVLGFKAIGVAGFLATCALVYLTARRASPAHALPAYVLIAWNPLFLFESAANGHNDTLMVACTALALYGAARRDWALALPALAAAVLIKYVTGLLGPLLLLWAWSETRRGRAEGQGLFLGVILAGLLLSLSYAALWAGADTFRALSGAAGDALNSPGWLAREALERAGLSTRPARLLVGLPLAVLFLTAYGAALRLAWRRPQGVTSLWIAGFLTLAVYLLTVSWWFWPWYVTWLLPLAALLWFRPMAALAVVWSIAALFSYVPINFRPLFWGEPPDDRMPLAVVLVVFLPVASAALLLLLRAVQTRQSVADRVR